MEIKLDIEFEKINRGFVDLKKASNIAAKNTLNIVAAMVRNRYKYNIRKNMIIRKPFLPLSIFFKKAEGENIALMESQIRVRESAAKILRLHEESGRRKPKHGSNLAIPQTFARGGSHRRPVSRSYYLRRLKSKKIKGKFKKRFRSRRAMGVARAYVAHREKKMVKYSDNLYLVSSFKKINKKVKYKKRHLYNVSERSVYIKKLPMLAPAIEQPVKDAQNIYNSQMKKLLRSKDII